MEEVVEKKKSVADVIIETFLRDVDEKEMMPWQMPYERYNAFNYFTGNTYRGINRLLLPFGEYMTAKQINGYNRKNNEDFRFQKGIRWYPVVFFTVNEKEIKREEVEEKFEGANVDKDGFIGSDGIWTYFKDKQSGKFFKRRNVLKYNNVAERKHFKNSKGVYLPSRLEEEGAEIILEDQEKVFQAYVNREKGLEVIKDSIGTPCYIPGLDRVELNPHVKSAEAWYSTAFHEFAHSSGHRSRLNRKGIHYPEGVNPKEKDNLYAVEECIAEITASLLCAECGIHSFDTSGTGSYDNNIAYVQSWKRRIQDWGKEFIYIVSQADKAFNFILGDTVDINR